MNQTIQHLASDRIHLLPHLLWSETAWKGGRVVVNETCSQPKLNRTLRRYTGEHKDASMSKGRVKCWPPWAFGLEWATKQRRLGFELPVRFYQDNDNTSYATNRSLGRTVKSCTSIKVINGDSSFHVKEDCHYDLY